MTADYTALQSDEVIRGDTSSGALTITLPALADRLGKPYRIKNVGFPVNDLTIDGNGTETIDGGLTAVLVLRYEALTIVSTTSEWDILAA